MMSRRGLPVHVISRAASGAGHYFVFSILVTVN